MDSKMIKKIKYFSEWLNEDFASLDSVQGMGTVEAPESNSIGSGDTWNSLSKPFTLMRKKRRKKKKKLSSL